MKTGLWISGIGHGALILWILFGGFFDRIDDVDLAVTDVSFITEAELQAMRQPQPVTEPETATAVAEPEAPETEAAPVTPAPDTPAESTNAPEITPPAEPSDAPDVAEIAAPDQPDVTETPPETPTPPAEEIVVLDAPTSPTPTPRAAPRVAPTPIEQPDPETEISETLQNATAPDAQTETPVEEQEATAEEETGDVIETEASEEVVERSAAPEASPRPPARPERPARPAAEPAETEPTEEESDPLAAAVAEAVADANEEPASNTPPAPTGPPLNHGEIEGFKVAVGRCWNVGASATADLQVIVVARVQLSADGRPESVEFLESQGGTAEAANRMFRAARSAIIRCGSNGFPLPRDKYGQWQVLDLVFDPSGMRLR